MKFIYHLNEIYKPVLYLREYLSKHKIINPVLLLSGDLGAGKTTFTSNFLKSYSSSIHVNSPSYTILNEYKYEESTIYHFDLYRLKTLDEVYDLGFDEIWGKTGISIVEWWEIAKDLFPQGSICLSFKTTDDLNQRELDIRII